MDIFKIRTLFHFWKASKKKLVFGVFFEKKSLALIILMSESDHTVTPLCIVQ